MNIVLNIVSKKQNLSYPLIFRKIGKYYWNEKILSRYLKCEIWNTVENCVENTYLRTIYLLPITPVYYFSSKKGNLKFVKYLFEKNPKETIAYVLFQAVSSGQLEIVKYLTEKGADIRNVLIAGCNEGHLHVIKYLVENGADIHYKNDWTLRFACERNQLDIVKYLIENGADIHAENEYPLRHAVEKHYLDLVKYLIENGADIHIDNEYVLEWAVKNNYLDIIQLLIENGAIVDAINIPRYLTRNKIGYKFLLNLN